MPRARRSRRLAGLDVGFRGDIDRMQDEAAKKRRRRGRSLSASQRARSKTPKTPKEEKKSSLSQKRAPMAKSARKATSRVSRTRASSRISEKQPGKKRAKSAKKTTNTVSKTRSSPRKRRRSRKSDQENKSAIKSAGGIRKAIVSPRPRGRPKKRSSKHVSIQSPPKSSKRAIPSKKQKIVHLHQSYTVGQIVDALYGGQVAEAKILEAIERDGNFFYRVMWIEDSKRNNEVISSIHPESSISERKENIRKNYAESLSTISIGSSAVSEEASTGQSSQALEREPVRDEKRIVGDDEKKELGAGLGISYDDGENIDANLDQSAVISEGTDTKEIPAVPDDGKSKVSVPTFGYVEFSSILLVVWGTILPLGCSYLVSDIVDEGLSLAAAVLGLLIVLFLVTYKFSSAYSDIVLLTIMASCAQYLGAGKLWGETIVSTLKSICTYFYLCGEPGSWLGLVAKFTAYLLNLVGDLHHMTTHTAILAAYSKTLPLSHIHHVLGLLPIGIVSFVLVNSLTNLMYWILMEPCINVGTFVWFLGAGNYSSADNIWNIYSSCRLITLGGLLWVIPTYGEKILRLLALAYLHYIAPKLQQQRVREVHNYLKQRDDYASQDILDLHMDVLKETEEPFRARVNSGNFMKDKPSNEKVTMTWFGLLSLESKKDKLRESLLEYHQVSSGSLRAFKKTPLLAERFQMFDSVAEEILAAKPRELAHGVYVKFSNEIGMDAGGLTKEFFTLVCNDLFPAKTEQIPGNQMPLLRRQSSVSGVGEPMFRELPDTSLMIAASQRPIVFYKALGRLFGMSVLYNSRGESALMPISLSNALLKFLLKHEIDHSDVRALDPDYFKHRIEFILSDGGVETMCAILGEEKLNFVEDETELKPNGKNIVVDEKNKSEYVTLLSEHYLCGQVRPQIGQFIQGFWEIVPHQILLDCNIDETELSLIFSGNTSIDVDEWKRNTEGTVIKYRSDLSEWFWECLREMAETDRARVLQFSTGLTRLPSGGFRELIPAFKIDLNNSVGRDHLPTSRTCFNTLCLPPYESKQELTKKLRQALIMDSAEFGFR
mmetsp:Transcript_2019/g.2883  ORF Transcript_2019/g.2883 Transcript_2019/m.2883 type:complete len:1057 (+) Transcript_2019:39-3209(+)